MELTWHLCSDADNPVDHQAPFVPSVEVLVKALIVISSAAVTGPPSSWIVRAIFCSHHPSVVGTGTREDVWKRLQKCLKTRESVCQSLLGPMGLMSPKTPEQQAAIFQTPEGMILNEQAIYVAQTIGAKYTNQEPAREAANSGRRDTAKLAKKADKGKTVKEEARELMLKEEMPLRRWVLLIMCFVTASYLFERIIHSQWLNQQMIYGHGHDLGTDYSGIFKALSHINLNINWSLHFISLYIRDATSGEDVFDAGWMGRQGIALALQSAADVLTTKDHPAVMTFLISRALADPNTYVRGKMINAGIMIIDKHGKENASDEEEYDLVREGVVIFTGSLAKHLAKDDPKVHNVVENLLEVLNTPSDSVQRAVLTCLSPLVLSKQEEEALAPFFEALR
ncbi:Armadillo-type fold [Arabidopsis thaliana x Arabidopsis arenosa]|uniref:Armadillo-type fold n=1 Tax=Arabidopsis thaliana x Arabidopsis arenosa TaxID=1240361 RepID=A0A8T2BKW7_9BRAS|nr:Armadillo-type fold [Arabidopsis thaliana x Arabidopsis arenosa]